MSIITNITNSTEVLFVVPLLLILIAVIAYFCELAEPLYFALKNRLIDPNLVNERAMEKHYKWLRKENRKAMRSQKKKEERQERPARRLAEKLRAVLTG